MRILKTFHFVWVYMVSLFVEKQEMKECLSHFDILIFRFCSLLPFSEYSSPDFADTPEYKTALNTPWRTKVMGGNNENILKSERRVMQLYRAWDPEAALKQDQ